MERILFYKYELIRQIGSGGAGRVYLAYDRHLKRLAAVKESRQDMSLTEMEFLRELEHPGLPVVYDYFEEQGSAFLVLEYIEGMTLRQYLDRHKRVKERQAVKWAVDLCRILKYLHGRHPAIIYRDLKPENIMVRQDGELKLIDLGGAIRYACGRKCEDMCAGTIGYCPREQWKETRGDVTWDIYALGAVLHEMLTGDPPTRPPYERHPLSEYDKSLTGALNKIIWRCTGEKGADRYQSVEQVEKALLDYRKRNLPQKIWGVIKRMIITAFASGTTVSFILPLLRGIPEDQFPFPYLKKPLFFLLVTSFLYLIFFKLKSKRNFLQRQEKNIWLTQKQFSGLLSFFLFLGAGILNIGIFGMTVPVVHAGDEAQQLWVEMRDEDGRKLLLKNDAVYITDDCVRFELPAERLPEEELSLQMIAVSENGTIYSSRIFLIRAQEDLN